MLVTVNTLPAVSGGLDVSVCIGDSAVLNGSGAVSYTWDNGIRMEFTFHHYLQILIQ